MKATVTEDAAGLRYAVMDDGSAEYQRAVEVIMRCGKWSEIVQQCEDVAREEGFKVMEAEIAALHAEVERLRKALCSLAMQEATLSVIDGEVKVEVGPYLTGEERLAIDWAASLAREQSQVAIHKTLRAMLEVAE